MHEGDRDNVEPGTLEDLIADADALGLEFNPRLARDWQQRGLLGKPQEREWLGKGRGSTLGIYSSYQRLLFRVMARHRADGLSLRTLATLSVWAWMHHGDRVVDLPQVRRALKTSIGNLKMSRRVASQTAQDLLRLMDFKQGRPGDRGRLRDELVNQLSTGGINEERLLPLVERVFQPEGILLARGPVDGMLTAQNITHSLALRMRAARKLQDVTEAQLTEARALFVQTYPRYLQDRERLQGEAGELAAMFDEPSFEDRIIQSASTLLLILGYQLEAAAAGRKLQP